MTLQEIQSKPYELKRIELPITSTNGENFTCFIGSIDKLSLLKFGVAGIFLISNFTEPSNEAEVDLFLKEFDYEYPKLEFKIDDCPQATHFIITSDFDPTDEKKKIFRQKLAYSQINKLMKEPCQDPFKDMY